MGVRSNIRKADTLEELRRAFDSARAKGTAIRKASLFLMLRIISGDNSVIQHPKADGELAGNYTIAPPDENESFAMVKYLLESGEVTLEDTFETNEGDELNIEGFLEDSMGSGAISDELADKILDYIRNGNVQTQGEGSKSSFGPASFKPIMKKSPRKSKSSSRRKTKTKSPRKSKSSSRRKTCKGKGERECLQDRKDCSWIKQTAKRRGYCRRKTSKRKK